MSDDRKDAPPARIVVDDVTFQRLTNAIRKPSPPNEKLIALFRKREH